MTIEVVEQEDGSFSISWDPEDPAESIMNDWVEEDFIEAVRKQCKEVLDGNV